MSRTVAFYVLWNDQTWEERDVELDGEEIFLENADAEALARAKLHAEISDSKDFLAIGPLSYIEDAGDLDG